MVWICVDEASFHGLKEQAPTSASSMAGMIEANNCFWLVIDKGPRPRDPGTQGPRRPNGQRTPQRILKRFLRVSLECMPTPTKSRREWGGLTHI